MNNQNNNNQRISVTGDVTMDIIFISLCLLILITNPKEVLILSILVYGIYKLINYFLSDELKSTVIATVIMVSVLIVLNMTIFDGFDYIQREFILEIKDMITNQAFMDYFLAFRPGKFLIAGISLAAGILIVQYFKFNQLSRKIERKRKEEEFVDEEEYFPLDYSSSALSSGSIGSGKTSSVMNLIDYRIKNNDFVFAMDGKGNIGEYSLYDTILKLCHKYNRKVYIVNQSDSSHTSRIDPFIGLNPTQIKDMLVGMTQWSEEHYKQLASRYWLQMAMMMEKRNIVPTFESIIYYSAPDNLMGLVYELYADNKVDKTTVKRLSDIASGSYGVNILSSVARFSVVYEGEGEKLFGRGQGFNVRKAYEENAVVLVMLNAFKYGDFAYSMGAMMMEDYKNLIGDLMEGKYKVKQHLSVFDELSVYYNASFNDIVNKTRDVGGIPIMITQTIADLEIINDKLASQLLGSTNAYIILRQNDPDSAEKMASIIGTQTQVGRTYQTEIDGWTGRGSDRIVQEFKVHPDLIKELPNLVGYWYDKRYPKDIKRFKVRFVDVSGIEKAEIQHTSAEIVSNYEYDADKANLGESIYEKDKKSRSSKTGPAKAENKPKEEAEMITKPKKPAKKTKVVMESDSFDKER